MIQSISRQGLTVAALAAFSVVSAPIAGQAPRAELPGDIGDWGPVEVVEDLRIGALDDSAEYMFGGIGSIAASAEGSIYVADNQLVLIRQYASDGRFVRNIGRQGEGPGEYSRMLGMKWLPDGMLAVLDGPHKIILYRPNGEYATDFRVPNTFSGWRMLEYDVSGNWRASCPPADKKRFAVVVEGCSLGWVRRCGCLRIA